MKNYNKAKQLSIPHLLRNQTPHSPVGAHGVPGVQAITARPQDMTKITEIMNKKPRGFMQSCFPVSVYFKWLSDFLLYFYKCSTSMAFT